MTVSTEHMSVNKTSYSQDVMGVLSNDWWKLIENFADPGA